MKKIVLIILCLVCAFSLVACDNVKISGAPKEILNELYAENETVAAFPYKFVYTELEKDNCSNIFNLNTEQLDMIDDAGYMTLEIGAIPHAGVLYKVKKGEDASKLAEDLLKNAKLNLFGCLSAKYMQVASRGDYILSVMGDEETVKSLFDSFLVTAEKFDFIDHKAGTSGGMLGG